MKLSEVILLSLITFLLIVAVHQTTVSGFVNSYWIFMLTFILFGFFLMAKSKNSQNKNKKADRQ
jgi:uncharacterized membrane protein YhaH (DUF805 family)